MRVKRLEIQGFKSFKDKTVIYFDRPITGIVGPNGCGKSNIVDAFFWVMGEQSYKHMRGTGAEDLIFNGSSKYTALGMAEATMVLETDFAGADAPTGATVQDIPVHLRSKEISVTRRVYRSGEGEYFINGVPARLKDIQELFMDTGVGAKGYSVIEQGQIGKIVNAKPEDRRLLIEEAAGIAKYKARKKESLRKMEATQSNLSRLNDVVAEIERNLNSLDRQAQKARQYKRYKDELLDKEMTWGRRKAQVLKQRLGAITLEKEAMEQELIALRASLSTLENDLETDRLAQVTDTKDAEDQQTRMQELATLLAQEQSALDLSRRRQGDLATQLSTLESEKQELETSIAAERSRITEREQEASQWESRFTEAMDRARSADERARGSRTEAENLRRELDSGKRSLLAFVNQASDLNSRSAALASRVSSIEAQTERLSHQLEAHQLKTTQARSEVERAETQVSELSSRREALNTEKREQAQAVQASEQALKQAERTREETAKKRMQLRSKVESLDELLAAREGFADGPKAALEWAREQGAGIQALADAFEVERGYESALEGWMEGRLQDLIAREPSAAIEAISALTSEKRGRAAIHLAGIVGSAQATAQDVGAERSALEAAGFSVRGVLSDFVKATQDADEVSFALTRNLLGNTIVVESLALLPAFLANGGSLPEWSLVALDGSALDRQGVLRGGTSEGQESTGLLARKREVADLHAQLESAQAELDSAESRVSEAQQALELGRARLGTLQSDQQAIDVQLSGVERELHQMRRALKDAQSQLEYAEIESKEFQEELEAARTERSRISVETNRIADERAALEARIAAQEQEVQSREESVRALETEASTLRVEEASLRERSVSLKRELEAGRSVIQDRERRLIEVNRTLERASQEHTQFSGSDEELERKIADLTRGYAAVKESLSIIKDRLEQSSSRISQAMAQIKEAHSTGDQKTADLNGKAIEFEKTSGELAHLVQNLEEKYGPGCLERPVTSPIQEEMSEPVITAEMSEDEERVLGEDVERLRERIRRLGEVNVMAIEEFEETKKRYDSLVGERTDLERSITNLQEAIEHINKTSEERFKKAFESIADRFERLFPIIFGGGYAKLSLVYPEGSTDILEAGVDILASPPGKKVSNIGLLSGGEKALTAVSLIFAIFMVKPSPFCVLDEVDAPLDDANIGKFNALLKEMASKSQFILITHNKKTMELNDSLYGVTMEEPGVSKMVSIQMQ